MKIAMIGHKRVPSREGGVEVAVEELSARLTGLGHDVTCYNRAAPGTPAGRCGAHTHRGIRIWNVGTVLPGGPGVLAGAARAVLRAIRDGCDVIHLHAEGPACAALLARLAGVPAVVTIHGLDWKREKWGRLASFFLRVGEKSAALHADELIVLTAGAQRYFQKRYGRCPHCVPNGVARPLWHEPDEITRRWGLKKDGYILFLARIVPEKGLHELIDAFSGLNTEKRLILAGRIVPGDAYTSRICAMAARDSRILMTDAVTGRTLSELLSGCCLYVLPSHMEGMSISLLEALSMGARCLVSATEENMETAGRHAVYFPPGDVQALRAGMAALLHTPDREEDRLARIRFVRENRNWDDIARQTLEIYESTIRRARARTGRRN